ncbi:MAG: exodeoxyribonuclease III [Planctomycetota bacterium]
MRLATWNVNSIRARQARVLAWLGAQCPDVLCLQETKCLDEQFPREPFEALGYHIACFGQKTYNGVAILSREPARDVLRGLPLLPGSEGGEPDLEARVIAGTVGDVRVINAYVVNGRDVGHEKYHYKLAWLARLEALLRRELAAHSRLVIVGDFNVTFDDRDVQRPDDWRERILCSTPERQALAALLSTGLHDPLRKFTEEPGHYTWWDFRTRGLQRGDGLRIDHLLMSKAALASCTRFEVDVAERRGEGASDHAPVTVTL